MRLDDFKLKNIMQAPATYRVVYDAYGCEASYDVTMSIHAWSKGMFKMAAISVSHANDIPLEEITVKELVHPSDW